MSKIDFLLMAIAVLGTLQLVGGVLIIVWSRHIIEITKAHGQTIKEILK